MTAPYDEKFAEFIRMCSKAKEGGVDTVIVAHPEVLGDNYDEIIESLSRLAEAELRLSIAGPSPSRGKMTPGGGAVPQ